MRLPGLFGVAIAQLRHGGLRTGLAVVAVALAVLAMTLLAGVGVGVVETGTAQLEAADQDLWLTGGPVGLTAEGGGGFENTIRDAHPLAADIAAHDGVANAIPLGFQTVYASADGEEFTVVIGSGTTGGGPAVDVVEGRDFSGSDTHYADGAYDGPMTHEVLIDETTAGLLGVGVGDTVHLGGTLAAARANEFEVVGISPTFASFIGAPTATMRLSELQRVTGTTRTDPATFVLISLEDDADAAAVQADLADAHPAYTLRSNREMLEATIGQQTDVLAGALALVVLAVAAGLALTTNALVLFVAQQRRSLAALAAIGISRGSIVGYVAGQGVVIGVLGGLLGVAATPVGARALNRVAEAVTGFEELVQVPLVVYGAGFAVAAVIGVTAAAIAAWRVGRP